MIDSVASYCIVWWPKKFLSARVLWGKGDLYFFYLFRRYWIFSSWRVSARVFSVLLPLVKFLFRCYICILVSGCFLKLFVSNFDRSNCTMKYRYYFLLIVFRLHGCRLGSRFSSRMGYSTLHLVHIWLSWILFGQYIPFFLVDFQLISCRLYVAGLFT